MKKLLLIFFLLPVYLTAQEEFSFQIFFEDALGNRDTVILGYDPNATDVIDVTFGEVNILSQPLGSNFDVRIGDRSYESNNGTTTWLTSNTYQSKKQILSSYCDQNDKKSETISLQFKIDNLPIKIKWNGNIFGDSCRAHSSFFGQNTSLQTDGFHGTPLLYGLGNDSIFIDKYTDQSNIEKLWVYKDVNQPQYTIQSLIENLDSIAYLQFYFWGEQLLNTTELEAFFDLKLFPNPTNDYLTIVKSESSQGEQLTVQIYSINGNLLQTEEIKENHLLIDLQQFQAGTYLVRITNDKGSSKFVKILKQ